MINDLKASCLPPPPNYSSDSTSLGSSEISQVYLDKSSTCTGYHFGSLFQCSTLCCLVLIGEEMDVGYGNKLTTLATWGPTFSFSLDLYLTVSETSGLSMGLIRFENEPANYGKFGCAIPSLTYIKGGGYHGLGHSMQYDVNDLWGEDSDYDFPLNTWFNVFISLYKDQVGLCDSQFVSDIFIFRMTTTFMR